MEPHRPRHLLSRDEIEALYPRTPARRSQLTPDTAYRGRGEPMSSLLYRQPELFGLKRRIELLGRSSLGDPSSSELAKAGRGYEGHRPKERRVRRPRCCASTWDGPRQWSRRPCTRPTRRYSDTLFKRTFR